MGTRAAVIVPAHDEEGSIARTLGTLLDGAAPGEIDVVVICNGCRDRTEAVARTFEPQVRVISIPQASKVAALNAGDELTDTYPRIYLDADVIVHIEAIREMVGAMEDGAAAACPGLRLDMRLSSRVVRSYFRLWMHLPSVREDAVGRGAYGVSVTGRARWGRFPDLLGDDHFVRSLFRRNEVRVVQACSTVRTPTDARALIRRKARVIRGNAEVDRSYGDGVHQRTRGLRGVVAALRQSPWRVVDLPAYLAITVAARALARWGSVGWGQDITSRGPNTSVIEAQRGMKS